MRVQERIKSLDKPTQSKLTKDKLGFDMDIYLENLQNKKEYKYPKGSHYEGQMNGSKRHGLGRLRWHQGSVYDGHWKMNKREGWGVMQWSDKSIYIGEWKDDERCGYGVYFLMEGHRYEGEFQKHKMHGYGKYIWPDDSYYEGPWHMGLRQGNDGLMRFTGNSQYKG